MARFVQTVNGEVVGRYDLLPQLWEGKNLNTMTRGDLKSLGWYHVTVEEPLGWDGSVYKLTGPVFTIREDDVLEKYILVPLSAEEIAEKQAAQQNITTISLTQEQIQSNQEIADLVNRLKTLTGQ